MGLDLFMVFEFINFDEVLMLWVLYSGRVFNMGREVLMFNFGLLVMIIIVKRRYLR